MKRTPSATDGRPLVLVAPNAFKGSLSAMNGAIAIGSGIKKAGGTPVLFPLADGGDGTLDILRSPLGLIDRRANVLDPLGRRRTALWGYSSKTRQAVIEMAQASGLAQVKMSERNPFQTTSYGTGQLIHAAIRAKAKTVFLGLGGSATVDGGLGILQALGAKIWVRNGEGIVPLKTPATGRDLATLHRIDAVAVAQVLKGVRLRVLCDVNNPLLGARGAARVFGPQKGATPTGVLRLERGLRRLAKLIRAKGKDISKAAGTGAAGGAGAGLMGFTKGSLERGTETIFRLIGLEAQIKRADLVLTGEGRVDRTSWEGKSMGELVRLCRRHLKPMVVLAGGIGPGGKRRGIPIVSLGDMKMSPVEKMRNAKRLLQSSAEHVLRFA